MDPIGAIGGAASIITLIGTAFTIAQTLHDLIVRLHDAPKEILALSNEVSELTLILSNLNNVTSAATAASASNPSIHPSLALTDTLDRAEQKLKDLNNFVRRLTIVDPSGEVEFDRIGWMMRKKKAVALQTDLKDIRVSLGVLFSASTMSGNTRIELAVSELFVATRTSSEDNTRNFHEASQERAEQRTAITTVVETTKQAAVQQDQYIREATADRVENKRALQTILERSVPLHKLAQLQEKSSAVIHDMLADDAERTRHAIGSLMKKVAPLDDVANAQQRSMRLLHTILDMVSVNSGRRRSGYSTPRADNEKRGDDLLAYNDTIGFKVTRALNQACRIGCSCNCHIRQHVQSPGILRKIVGSLFIGYTGHPTQLRPCNEASCRQRSNFSAQITYYFPQWFMMKMIAMVIMQDAFGDFLFRPKVARIVPGNAKIFSYVSIGDVSGIRSLISKGLASPSDTRDGSGVTPLAYAIYCGRINVCKTLLDAGSDPYYEDGTGRSPMARAWTAILSNTLSKEYHEILQALFNDKDTLSERKFSIIQKIVLGLIDSDLEKELLRSTATIDQVDSEGHTALSWAAQRKDHHSVRTLLMYNANPNIYNNSGRGPLHLAAEKQSVECMELLVRYKADISRADQWGLTPLLDACWEADKPSALYPMLVPGVDLNVRAKSGRNALAYAATRDHLAMAKFLLESGAAKNIQDNHGYTAVFIAIVYHSHRVLPLLLEYGADYTIVDNKKNTILHMAADFGTIETLEVLSRARLTKVHVNQRNANRVTARELAQARVVDSDPGVFAEAFEGFLRSTVVERGSPIIDIPDQEDMDIFEDALDTTPYHSSGATSECFEDSLDYQASHPSDTTADVVIDIPPDIQEEPLVTTGTGPTSVPIINGVDELVSAVANVSLVGAVEETVKSALDLGAVVLTDPIEAPKLDSLVSVLDIETENTVEVK